MRDKKITLEQLKKRIQHRMEDYVHANIGPYSKPRQRRVKAPVTASAEELKDALSVGSHEKMVINLHTIKQALSPNEQEVLAFRLMGYKVEEIAKSMMVAAKTVEGYLTSIRKACKEVNNVQN